MAKRFAALLVLAACGGSVAGSPAPPSEDAGGCRIVCCPDGTCCEKVCGDGGQPDVPEAAPVRDTGLEEAEAGAPATEAGVGARPASACCVFCPDDAGTVVLACPDGGSN